MDKQKKDRDEKHDVSTSLTEAPKNGVEKKRQANSDVNSLKSNQSEDLDLNEVNARKEQARKQGKKNPSAEAMGDTEDEDLLNDDRFNQRYDQNPNSVESPYRNRGDYQSDWNDNMSPNQRFNQQQNRNQWNYPQDNQRNFNQHNFDPYQGNYPNNPYQGNYQNNLYQSQNRRRLEENQWNNAPSQQYGQFDHPQYNHPNYDYHQPRFNQHYGDSFGQQERHPYGDHERYDERNYRQNDFNHYRNDRRDYSSHDRPYERNNNSRMNDYHPQNNRGYGDHRPSYRDYDIYAEHNDDRRDYQNDIYARDHAERSYREERANYYPSPDRDRRPEIGYDYSGNQGRGRNSETKQFGSRRSVSSKRGRR